VTRYPVEEAWEVPAELRFRSRAALDRHVAKHPLRDRAQGAHRGRDLDERWHQAVDPDLLAAARDEYAEAGNAAGPHCRRLARAYEELASREVHRACLEHREHAHFLKVRPSPDFGVEGVAAFDSAGQVVLAGISELRLFVAAEKSVRSGEAAPSFLRTAYRPYPRLGVRPWMRKFTEKVSRRSVDRGERLLARHFGGSMTVKEGA